MKLSIIIPMYNVEKYIERCLASCLNQENVDKDEYEVIIINDGSKDNSLQVAKIFVTGRSNVTIVSQENRGQSAARNKGVSLAKGDYIWFVDSDDWISKDAVSVIIQYIIENKPDLIAFRAADSIGNDFIIRQRERKTGIFSANDIFNNANWDVCPPFYAIHRELWMNNDLRFYEGIFHEDNEFIPRMFYFAKDITIINNVLYYIYQNPQSTTRTINPKRAFDLIVASKSLYSFAKKHVTCKKTKKTLNKFIAITLNSAINQYMLMDEDNSKKFQEILKDAKSMLITNMFGSEKIKHRIQGILISVMPITLYLKIHRMISK